jgi:hypothetical protein
MAADPPDDDAPDQALERLLADVARIPPRPVPEKPAPPAPAASPAPKVDVPKPERE